MYKVKNSWIPLFIWGCGWGNRTVPFPIAHQTHIKFLFFQQTFFHIIYYCLLWSVSPRINEGM